MRYLTLSHFLCVWRAEMQLSCGTCPICDAPPAVDGVDIIIQAIPISDTKVSIWFDATIAVAGAQFDNICTCRAAREPRMRS